ncbi:hypothetical protein [Phytoactinopolyspora halotolerans]|uniref:Uncharacterized protein n=1 Tax=Phytoactinopolyspora halotolerans TaxID=1981512 RepID=A0A6L9SDB2_9ACTN|nr:hypothetical protein [Phytoactinopolyspora halotolerans]NEE02614.1 hypothetical protein [Phytoactinopolyspora halotolerans]
MSGVVGARGGLIRYDPDVVSEDELRRTLEQVGYTYRDPDKVRSFEEEESELHIARNRMIVAGALAGITAVLMFLGMEPSFTVLEHPYLTWVMFALALETMFVTAWFVKRMAWASLRRGILNQHVLLEFGVFAGLAGGLLGLFVSDESRRGISSPSRCSSRRTTCCRTTSRRSCGPGPRTRCVS